MTWTAPRTWVTDEIVTSSLLNTHVRDNLLSLSHSYDYSVSDTDVANTAAETSLWSKVITGGDMGSNGMLKLSILGDYLHNNAGGDSLAVKVKFGGTTIFNDTLAFGGVVGATRQPFWIEAVLANRGSTSSQLLSGLLFSTYANTSAPATGIGFISHSVAQTVGTFSNTAAIDTTTDQTFQITVQWSTASANNSWRKRLGVLNLAKN